MSRYVIVSFVEDEYPKTFIQSEWPLHVTLVSPFSSTAPTQRLIDILKEVCLLHEKVVTEGKSRELFGPDATISVTELVNTPALQALRDDLREAYRDLIEFTGPQYPSYRPHVTDSERSVVVGEKISVRALSLVQIDREERQEVYSIELK